MVQPFPKRWTGSDLGTTSSGLFCLLYSVGWLLTDLFSLVLSSTVVTDPENPAFDLEKFIAKLEQDSQ